MPPCPAYALLAGTLGGLCGGSIAGGCTENLYIHAVPAFTPSSKPRRLRWSRLPQRADRPVTDGAGSWGCDAACRGLYGEPDSDTQRIPVSVHLPLYLFTHLDLTGPVAIIPFVRPLPRGVKPSFPLMSGRAAAWSSTSVGPEANSRSRLGRWLSSRHSTSCKSCTFACSSEDDVFVNII